jgi:hypothetical protein
VFGLYHSAVVTVNQATIKRSRLIAAMREAASDAVQLLGGIDDDEPGWSFFLGDTYPFTG